MGFAFPEKDSSSHKDLVTICREKESRLWIGPVESFVCTSETFEETISSKQLQALGGGEERPRARDSKLVAS